MRKVAEYRINCRRSSKSSLGIGSVPGDAIGLAPVMENGAKRVTHACAAHLADAFSGIKTIASLGMAVPQRVMVQFNGSIVLAMSLPRGGGEGSRKRSRSTGGRWKDGWTA